MNYQVSQKGGASVLVCLRETGEGIYEITIDGHTVHVDAVRSGPTIYSVIEDGQQFEAMVDEQVAVAKPTLPELIYGRLHSRWPRSRGITRRLERAQYRAANGGPINATPFLLVLLVGGLFALAFIAFATLSQGFGQDGNTGKPGVYPTYSYGP